MTLSDGLIHGCSETADTAADTPTTSSANVRDGDENAAMEAVDDDDFYIDVNAESDDEL